MKRRLRYLSLVLFLIGSPIFAAFPAFAQDTKSFSAPTSPLIFKDPLANGGACPHCPQMAMLPPGLFVMGAMPGVGNNNERTSRNRPIPVEIKTPFAISVHEVTRSEFAAFIEARPQHDAKPGCAGLFDGIFEKRTNASWRQPGFTQADDHPVVCVTWEQANAYAAWLSELSGQDYRLPSEAQWEYAARAGSAGRYWWGERMEQGKANCFGDQCAEGYAATAPAGAFEANPFGLHNLVGNVWEWTDDCYLFNIYDQKPHAFPLATKGPNGCKRVIRGGSWSDNPWVLRSSMRESSRPDVPLNDLGFRVVRHSSNLPI